MANPAIDSRATLEVAKRITETKMKVRMVSTANDAAGVEPDPRRRSVSVGSEALDALRIDGRPGEDGVQAVGAGDAPGYLGYPVPGGFGDCHPAGNDETERHSRVHVTAGDGPDGVDQRHEHEAEGQGGGHDTGGITGPEQLEAEAQGGHPHGHKDQYCGAEEFGNQFAHIEHETLPSVIAPVHGPTNHHPPAGGGGGSLERGSRVRRYGRSGAATRPAVGPSGPGTPLRMARAPV